MPSLALLAADAPEANVWTAMPSILWFALAAVMVAVFFRQLRSILNQLAQRLRSGQSLKIGAVEFGAVVVAPGGAVGHGLASAVRKDDGTREAHRRTCYQQANGAMLVHRLFRSAVEGQVYDALIYLVPHGDGTLAAVSRVEYYLGQHWGSNVFTATDRSRGFPLLVSAYGAFLCTAELFFTAGGSVTLSRYIDFEMGATAPLVEKGG